MRRWQAVSGSGEPEGELISEKGAVMGTDSLRDSWAPAVFLDVQERQRAGAQLSEQCMVFSKLLIYTSY